MPRTLLTVDDMAAGRGVAPTTIRRYLDLAAGKAREARGRWPERIGQRLAIPRPVNMRAADPRWDDADPAVQAWLSGGMVNIRPMLLDDAPGLAAEYLDDVAYREWMTTHGHPIPDGTTGLGKPIRGIADECGVSAGTVHTALRDAGIPLRPPGASVNPKVKAPTSPGGRRPTGRRSDAAAKAALAARILTDAATAGRELSPSTVALLEATRDSEDGTVADILARMAAAGCPSTKGAMSGRWSTLTRPYRQGRPSPT